MRMHVLASGKCVRKMRQENASGKCVRKMRQGNASGKCVRKCARFVRKMLVGSDTAVQVRKKVGTRSCDMCVSGKSKATDRPTNKPKLGLSTTQPWFTRTVSTYSVNSRYSLQFQRRYFPTTQIGFKTPKWRFRTGVSRNKCTDL